MNSFVTWNTQHMSLEHGLDSCKDMDHVTIYIAQCPG